MATTRKTKINPWYAKYALEHMTVDQDEKGLFYQLPSEKEENTFYTVRVDETGDIPVVTSCSCVGHVEYGYNCKHMIIATSFIRRIYKSTLAKLEAKAEIVQQSEYSVTDIGLKGNFGSKPFSLLAS